MLETFDCKDPQKSLIATICSKAGSGDPLVTVLSSQLLQTFRCSAIMNPRFHNCPLQQTLCNYSVICNAFLNAKLVFATNFYALLGEKRVQLIAIMSSRKIRPLEQDSLLPEVLIV